MLPHPAAANPADVVQFSPNKSAAGVICNKPVDPKQHHCYGCRYGGGVDRKHTAVGRCLADVIQSHSGVKVFIEHGWISSLTLTVQSRIWMSLLLLLSRAIRPWCLLSAQNQALWRRERRRPNLTGYPHINLVPFMLETTGRPGPHAKKFTSYLMRDADNPPLAIKDTWSAIQCVLHSAISKQQLTAAVT